MYRRETRAIQLPAMPPPLAHALASYASNNQLELAGARAWITRSESPIAEGFFGKLLGRRANPVDPNATVVVAVVLQRTHITVATSGDRSGISVLSCPLAQASVSRGSAIANRVNAPGLDDGISITGFPTSDPGTAGSCFVGLGPEPARVECARAVEAAIVAAKNPR